MPPQSKRFAHGKLRWSGSLPTPTIGCFSRFLIQCFFHLLGEHGRTPLNFLQPKESGKSADTEPVTINNRYHNLRQTSLTTSYSVSGRGCLLRQPWRARMAERDLDDTRITPLRNFPAPYPPPCFNEISFGKFSNGRAVTIQKWS